MKKKIILIIGGTGSFGSAVVSRLINKNNYSEIRILSRDEKKQEDFRQSLKSRKVKFFLGDVRDLDSVMNACQNVDHIFHAAALKQVPSCEFYPMEAIKTNVLGTSNVISAATRNNVKKVVFLSTDKAVYPINTMGMTKALMEKIVISKSLHKNKKTIFCITRYGNVMGSRGSVIPLMINQIKKNKPITLTSSEMTRFMMSMDEALDLVDYALKNAKNGEIFIKKTVSCSIGELINALKKIYKKPNHRINKIGYRHGEKKHECLMSFEEKKKSIDKGKFYVVKPDVRDLNYDKFYLKGYTQKYKDNFDYTSENAKKISEKNLIKKINSIFLNF